MSEHKAQGPASSNVMVMTGLNITCSYLVRSILAPNSNVKFNRHWCKNNYCYSCGV